jgi:hypothetical protein
VNEQSEYCKRSELYREEPVQAVEFDGIGDDDE